MRYLILAGLVLALPINTLHAADDNWGLCQAPTYTYFTSQNEDQAITEVESDYLLRDDNDLLTFRGNVRLKRANQTLLANHITLDESNDLLEANGAVIIEKSGLRLSTEHASFNQKNDSALIAAADFELSSSHARGSAGKIEILDNARSRFSEFVYTSCDPDDRDWHFTGDQFEVNDETGLASAQHATIYFQEVPFFYFPYFQFPIDDRRMSGVLVPSFKISNSDNDNLTVPIYWNIAPNIDTTFRPAWYQKRGLLYNSEHRYLFEQNQGQIDYSRLDDKVDDEVRWFKRWQHQSDFGFDIDGDLLLQAVSDNDYFGDFSKLTTSSSEVDYLDRHLKLNHQSEFWKTSLLWQNYQTVDEEIAIASRPYQRLPQLSVTSKFQPWDNGLHFEMDNEWVRFKREGSITGERTHVVPSLSWTSSNNWYFVTPKLQYALTDYSLDNNTLGDNEIDRSIPITSLDTGLFFERTTGPNDSWLQTLEPRLYFVHVPFKDQSDIPDFDTAVLGESYANFFQPNRFSGSDRIGDTDQVTFGLGSRVYSNDSGDQLLYARVAQVFYSEDRQVSLGNSVDESDRSNILAAIDINPTPHLKIGVELIHDVELHEINDQELSINWAKDGFAANIEYFLHDETLEQSVFSLVYPINERWTFFAKAHRSLLFREPIENLAGLSYESCCWALKILMSEVSDDDFEEVERGWFFELTLKGLTQTGSDVDGFLTDAIPGYRSNF